MRSLTRASVFLCILTTLALTAPIDQEGSVSEAQADTLEEELRLQALGNEDSLGSQSGSESDEDEDTYIPATSDKEDEFYDLTVGEVIKDVLLTLRDHPEIVKALIESEKKKLADKLSQVSEGKDSGEDLGSSEEERDDSGGTDDEDNLSDFQMPPKQLDLLPKMVEKKAGPRTKNPSEIPSSSSGNIGIPISMFNWAGEGGLDDPMFANERQQTHTSESLEAEDLTDQTATDNKKTEKENDDDNLDNGLPSNIHIEKIPGKSKGISHLPWLNPSTSFLREDSVPEKKSAVGNFYGINNLPPIEKALAKVQKGLPYVSSESRPEASNSVEIPAFSEKNVESTESEDGDQRIEIDKTDSQGSSIENLEGADIDTSEISNENVSDESTQETADSGFIEKELLELLRSRQKGQRQTQL